MGKGMVLFGILRLGKHSFFLPLDGFLTFLCIGKHIIMVTPCFLRQSFIQSKPRYLVYVCEGVCGGWADRQEGIVAGFLLASLTGRQFHILHEKPCSITDAYVPNKVDWKLTPTLLRALRSSSTTKLAVLDHRAFDLRKDLVTQDPNTRIKGDVVYFKTNQDMCNFLKLNPLWKNLVWARGMKCAHVYTAVWEHLFKLSPVLERGFLHFTEKLKKRNGTDEDRYTLVCAQFRLKRNPSNPRDGVLPSWVNHKPMWDFLQAYNNSEKYRIFIATDAQHIQEQARAKFPTVLLNIPGRIRHVDRDHNGDSASFQKVLLDQLALSSGDVLIAGFQTHLGVIAAYWRGRDEGLFCFNSSAVPACSIYAQGFHFR